MIISASFPVFPAGARQYSLLQDLRIFSPDGMTVKLELFMLMNEHVSDFDLESNMSSFVSRNKDNV